MTPAAKSRLIRRLAADLGFERVGITSAERQRRTHYYKDWLARGHAGSMGYLFRNVETRAAPARLLAGARTIICVGLNYRRCDDRSATANRPANQVPCAADSEAPDGAARRTIADNRGTAAKIATGRIAQYARGDDYHAVMHGMLAMLLERLRAAVDEPFAARVCIDTQPLLERDLARDAGLGWIGKNTMLLHETYGSYLFLGEVLTTLELEEDGPVTDHCGTCTRCLDACPTNAFFAPYQLDASRCIAYFTIEHRGEIPAEVHAAIGDWVFGCDVCQEVCPFNAEAPIGRNAQINRDRLPARISLPLLQNLTAGGYRRLTKDSATRRATRKMWMRNAAIAMSNAQNHGSDDSGRDTAVEQEQQSEFS
jgi:epoxyqueuosine reductase